MIKKYLLLKKKFRHYVRTINFNDLFLLHDSDDLIKEVSQNIDYIYIYIIDYSKEDHDYDPIYIPLPQTSAMQKLMMMKLKVNLFFIIEEFSKYFNGIWDKVCGSTEKKKNL